MNGSVYLPFDWCVWFPRSSRFPEGGRCGGSVCHLIQERMGLMDFFDRILSSCPEGMVVGVKYILLWFAELRVIRSSSVSNLWICQHR